MNIIEVTIALLAPHTCLRCGREGPPLCNTCSNAVIVAPPPRCYRCYGSTSDFATCRRCQPSTPLEHVWVSSNYEAATKQLLTLLKFQRGKAAAEVIANCLHHQLPALPSGVIVTAAPTTAVRVRQRGYDQARLIARHVAKKRNLPYLETLRRTKNTRQVGSNRAERFIQLENAFTAHRPERIDGKHLLVIDDVLTTGATLESAARTLKMVGAATVDAAVFAHQLKLTSSSSTKSDSKSGR